MRELIDTGHLAPLVSKRMATQLDVGGVVQAQEFIAKELNCAIGRMRSPRSAVEEILAYGHDHQERLVFCAGVDHAFHVARCFTCQRDRVLDHRRRLALQRRARSAGPGGSGELDPGVLTNANVLTTGFNAPASI